MLVCNISQRPPRRAIAADLAESAAADDSSTTGTVVFATIVDDPANVNETVDAYLGDIMLEVASAADTVTGSVPAVYAVDIAEAVTATTTQDATAALPPPLDGLSPTGAWSFSRQLLTSYGGAYYAATGGAITTLYDQSGSSRNFTDGGNSGRRPAEVTAGPNNRSAASYNGTSNYLLTSSALSSLIANNAGFVVCSAIITSIATNQVTSYNNDALLGDQSQYMGIHLRNLAGGTVYAFTWDGGEKATSTTFTVGVPIVFTWRHEGGNLYVSVNGGTETSVAAGNTSTMTFPLWLGGGGIASSTCKIFEAATWSTVPDATTRANIIADFKAWVGA